MGFVRGEDRNQSALFPVALDELVPAEHVCRVIEAFVDQLPLVELGFTKAQPRATGRPPYDPGDLLKLYLYGYLHQVRSSRRLERECQRNVEVMWLLNRLAPDHKTIAQFRRDHGIAVKQAGAHFVRFCQGKTHVVTTEPEARKMKGRGPSYNVQTAVDGAHALIVSHTVSTDAADSRQLRPMAEAARDALQVETLDILADAGYSNGEQAAGLEAQAIWPHVPAHRAVNNQGGGALLDRTAFHYHQVHDTLTCPAGWTLTRKQLQRRQQLVIYQARPEDCGRCPLKPGCTEGTVRYVSRHVHEAALDRMHARATPEVMRRRRCTVEHPFAGLKYRIFEQPRFLLRGMAGVRTEIAIGTLAWNLKRAMRVLGTGALQQRLAAA